MTSDLTWYEWLGIIGIIFFSCATEQVALGGLEPVFAIMDMVAVTAVSAMAFYIGYKISKEY